MVCLFVQNLPDRAHFTMLWPLREETALSSESEGKEEQDDVPTFQEYRAAMTSFNNVKWLRDVERKASNQPGAGKGVFACRDFEAEVCIAIYSGHLVSDDGKNVILCPSTLSLFQRLPALATRSWSAGHCAKIKGRRTNLMVDGTHHACSDYDFVVDRNGLNWGSCINSSIYLQAVNCKIIW